MTEVKRNRGYDSVALLCRVCSECVLYKSIRQVLKVLESTVDLQVGLGRLVQMVGNLDRTTEGCDSAPSLFPFRRLTVLFNSQFL